MLGNDFIENYKLHFNYENHTFFFPQYNLTFPFDYTNPNIFNTIHHIYTAQLPARSESFIQVIGNCAEDCFIPQQEVAENVFIGNCIVSGQHNTTRIPIINSNQTEVSLKNINIKTENLSNYHIFHLKKSHYSSQSNPKKLNNILSLIDLKHLNKDEQESITEIINEFADVFHLENESLGHTNAIMHEIKTIEGVEPIFTRPYRIPETLKNEVDTQINNLLKDNIITHSKSPWNSPLLIVPKKSQSNEKKWRLCIDFRKLNNVTIKDNFPLPLISEILDQLGNSRYFTSLDLASGFHQVQMHPKDQEKTAFSTRYGHYEFCRMPFGLTGSPATFQRLMNKILIGLQGLKCFIYLDDVIIHAKNLNDHARKLREVLTRFQSYNLKLQPSKCQFMKREIQYLGHIITENGVKPDPKLITSVINSPIPKNIKQLQSFLGLANYYRKFIQNFSNITAPLNKLLRKNIKFNWTNSCTEAFESLKLFLTSAPLLKFPDFEKTFILTTDSSGEALGAVLEQPYDIGEELINLPCSYASRVLNAAERNYSATERELLAVVWAITVFRPYLYGREFIVQTDHKPLIGIFRTKDISSRLLRWKLKLDEYDYKIVHVPGKKIPHADGLSRMAHSALKQNCMSVQAPIQNSTSSNDLERQINSFNQGDFLNVTINKVTTRAQKLLKSTSDTSKACSSSSINTNSNDENFSSGKNTTSSKGTSSYQDELSRNQTFDSDDDDTSNALLKYEETNDLVITENKNITEFKNFITYINNCPQISNNIRILKDNFVDIEKTNEGLRVLFVNLQNDLEYLSVIPSLSIGLIEQHPSPFEFTDSNQIFYLIIKEQIGISTYHSIFNSLLELKSYCITHDINVIHIPIHSLTKNFLDKYTVLKMVTFVLSDLTLFLYEDKIERLKDPKTIESIIKMFHNSKIGGHMGISKTLQRISQYYKWKGMYRQVKNFIKKCSDCQRLKSSKNPKAPLEITTTAINPFQKIYLDIVGPLEVTHNGNKYLLTAQCELSKYLLAIPISNAEANTVAHAFASNIVCIFGSPQTIVTDQGTNFMSNVFKETAKILKIVKLNCSAYHPESNGSLERSHKVIGDYLRVFASKDPKIWDTLAPFATYSYNTAIHSATNYSPFELVFGRTPEFPTKLSNKPSPVYNYDNYSKLLKFYLERAHHFARNNLIDAKHKYKTDYDKLTTTKNFRVDDLVLIKNNAHKVGECSKLAPKWLGPFRIIKIISPVNYIIKQNNKNKTYHVNNLKKYHPT